MRLFLVRPRKKIIICLLGFFLALTAAAAAKRAGPPLVPPLIQDHVKYTAPHFAGDPGRDQNGGYLEARDAVTGALLWTLKIYTVIYRPGLEKDVQDIFITRMALENNRLVIWNQRNDSFTVNLKTRKVTPENQVYR